MDRRAFQDQLTFNYCWGCGMMNPHGLHFKSFWDDGEAVCRWSPQPDHMAGPQHVLNGGIIATVMDCHCVCTAVAAAYRSAGRPTAGGGAGEDYRGYRPQDHPGVLADL